MRLSASPRAVRALLVLALSCAPGASWARDEASETDLLGQGRSALERQDGAQAARLYEQALQRARHRAGETHPQTLAAIAGLASAYGQLGRHTEQVALLEPLLARQTETLGDRHRDTLTTMSNLALAFGAQGRLSDQSTLAAMALRLRTEAFGERDPDTLTSMSNAAQAYGALGRHAEQLTLNERALRLRRERFGERHLSTLASMHNVAATYGALGRLTEQLPLVERVLQLTTEVLGERDPRRLTAMSNLAATYGALGRIAERLALEEKALALRIDIHGERHPETLSSMSGMAATYAALGRPAESLAWRQKALQLRSEVHGERHPATLSSLLEVSAAYGALGRTAERVAWAEKALRLHAEVLGDRHPGTLSAMRELAAAYGAAKRPTERLALVEQALQLLIETHGDRHPSTLEALNQLATAYGALGRVDEQVRTAELVLQRAAETFGAHHPHTLSAILGLARAYAAAKRGADVASLSDRYVAGAEWQRSQPGLSADDRQTLFRNHAQYYRYFALAHAGQDQVADAIRLTELGKARTLLEGMAMQQAGRSAALPQADRERLEDLNREVGALGEAMARADGAEARQRLEAARNEAVRRFEALQSTLRERHPKFAQLGEVRVLGAADLPGLVPRDAIALSYVVFGDVVRAFTVETSGPPRWHRLGVVPHLDDAVEILRRGQADERRLAEVLAEDGQRAWRLKTGGYVLRGAGAPKPADATEVTAVDEVARYLAARLLQPLARELRGKGHWIVSPDGPLARLAFEALPFGDAGQPVVASAVVHTTQSLSVYALSRALQRQYEGLRERRDLFAMGNAQYEAPRQDAAARRGLRQSAEVRGAWQLRELDRLWGNLPGTEAEVRAVAALFRSADAYLGADATEQQLQRLNAAGELTRYRYLLMSAHGYLSMERPELSSIVLGLRQRTPDADGYVTAGEWAGYDLRSDLVVLSACDSGLGRVVSGEGVMGLPFALFVAGNVNTVLSLWPVDDEATAEFVTRLFTKLRDGQTAAQALAATKREFLRHPRFSHPSRWAPFILVGAG